MLKKKMKTGDIVFNICNYTIMFLLLFICVYPFYYILIYAISDPELAAKGLTFYPKGLTLENFTEVVKLEGIFRAFGVSVARTVIGTALNVMTSMFLGYLFTNFAFPSHFQLKCLNSLLLLFSCLKGFFVNLVALTVIRINVKANESNAGVVLAKHL